MRFILLISILFLGSNQEGIDFFVKLKDGTLFSSRFEIDKLQVKTDFGDLEVPLADIRSIRATKDGFLLVAKKNNKESKINCKIEKDITFKTKHGTLNVKMKDVAEMVPAKKTMFHDDSVVGFWDFTGDEDLKTHGCEFVTEEDTSAVKIDLSKGDYIEIPHKPEHNQKEAVTVEIRFKIKDFSGNQTLLFSRHPSYSLTATNYFFVFYPSSKYFSIGTFNENKSHAFVYKSIDFEAQKWVHLAAVIDAKNKKIDIYKDGSKLDAPLSGNFSGESMATDESPIYICKEAGGSTSTIHFDFVRISSVARTEEEIKEMWETGSLGGSFKPSGDNEYKTVIVTKQGERYACNLESSKLDVETSLGDVQVDINKIGKITYFEYRKEQIEKLHKQAKTLILKLGDDDPVARDTAQEDLKKMGWVIMPVLEEFKDHKDEEVKSRVLKLIENFAGKKYEIKKDLIDGSGWMLRGWIKHNNLKAKTKYGEINVVEEDVKGIVFSNKREKVQGAVTFRLKDNSLLSGKLSQDQIRLKSEYGDLKIDVAEIISITFGKTEDLIVTKKSTFSGTITDDEFKLESQIGKIKIKKDQIVGIITGMARIEEGNVARGAKVTGGTQPSHLTDGIFSYDNYAYQPVDKSMVVELKNTYVVSLIGLYLYDMGCGYSYKYEIEVSADNKNWTKVIDKTDKNYNDWQLDTFIPMAVKYIRITGKQCSHNGHLYLVEIEVYCSGDAIRTPKLPPRPILRGG